MEKHEKHVSSGKLAMVQEMLLNLAGTEVRTAPMIPFGRILIMARVAHGWTQAQLSSKADIHTNTIGQYEGTIDSPDEMPYRTLKLWALGLGTTPETLIEFWQRLRPDMTIGAPPEEPVIQEHDQTGEQAG